MKKFIFLFVLQICAIDILHSQELHIYGGEEQNEYLGCLTSSSRDKNSIWNTYGKYGNPYNTKSIWNAYGTYGNDYNSYSPWNDYSYNPPIILGDDGKFYGYFTRNTSKPNRAEFRLALLIYGNYEDIQKDVDEWYNRFRNMGLVD